MGLRSLILILGILLVIHLVRRAYRQLHPPGNENPSKKVDTVRCDACGMYLPKSEAFERHGKHYCCKAHREKGRSRKG